MDSIDIDGHILASCHDRWQKVAMVIASASQSAGLPHADQFDIIATRIIVLVRAGKLDAVGDLNDWRDSEIRLPRS